MALPSIPLVRHIRQLASRSEQASDTDAALLDRFARRRDEDAFTALVDRHGPMVLQVCRRVLGDAHAAADVFQAVFLVLARKAGSLHRPDALAGWLHGVARRLALKARADIVRRQRHLTSTPLPDLVSPQSDPMEELSARELLGLLDDELQRLPEVYRLPMILCCLEGRTQEEAARLLGLTPGAVKGRLERGRARLHDRLARRGVALSAALLALELSRGVGQAVVPAALSARTVRGALELGLPGTTAGASVYAATLAEEALKSVGMTRLSLGAVLLLTVTLLAVSAGAIHYSTSRGNPLIAPGNLAARRADTKTRKAVDMLKADVDSFRLMIQFLGAPGQPFHTIELLTKRVPREETPGHWAGDAIISKELAGRIIDHLADTGFFQRARIGDVAEAARAPQWAYRLYLRGAGTSFDEVLLWDVKMLQRLDALRKVLDGDAARLMDRLLTALEGERKRWALPGERAQHSHWGGDSKGLQCRVQAPTHVEQGMRLEARVDMRSDPARLEPGVKQLNVFLAPAYLELVLTSRATGKQYRVKPYDPAQGMPVQDRGDNRIPLNGKVPAPWVTSFPLVQLGAGLEPGAYDCRVEFSYPKAAHPWWRGTAAEWEQAGFWHGTVRSGSFRLEVQKEKPRTETFLLPKSLRLERGATVTFRQEDTEKVTLPVRNGHFVGTQIVCEGQVGSLLMGGSPKPGLELAIVPKKGDRKVDVIFEVFETSTPPQHHWSPGPGSGGYKVLWKKTLTLSLKQQ